jgi:hypothetical protein
MRSTSRLNRPSPSLSVCPSSFSLLPVRLEVLMVPKEDVGGSEIHEMNIILGQSERKSNDGGALADSTDQDPDPEILPVISQDEGATFYFSLTIVFQVK